MAGPARLTAATSPRHQPGNRYLNAHNAYNSSENTDHLVSRQDQQAGPIHCPEPPRWHGSFRARTGRRYAVEACDGHRAPLENVRPIRR